MRLSSIESNEVDDEFMRAAVDCEHLCPQFHPALQSGSDTVLARMRRRYRIGRFLDKLDRMRDLIPHVAFTTDVIVGFPGETDKEFAQTLAACRQAGFMKIHVFPFSPRRGTPAADFPDQVLPHVRKARCEELSILERQLAVKYYGTHVGRELEVLVERSCEERPGWVRGTDRHYIPVHSPGTVEDIGEFVTVRGDIPCQEFLQAARS
jgi:threonylcarbamoyladenosine tRNA methylthiotransferase MtaB